MVKNAISDYSSTAASNTDVGGVNVDEGMPPSSINNAIREIMSHLADLNAGSSSLGTIKVDNLQLDGNAITSTDTDGDITITPNGNGNVVIDGLNYPQVDATANYFLKTDGAGQLSFAQVGTASIVDDAITAAKINDNEVGAAALNVSGNGTAGQFLASDGDGTMTWTDAGGGFAYNGVTGTTPSLDLGSYNFFNQGALTGNTTLTFASAPTEHKWNYTFRTAGTSGAFDISTTVKTGDKFVVRELENVLFEFRFGDSGSKLYVHSNYTTNSYGYIYQYNLSTAYQLSTATYSGNSLNIFSTENRGTGISFKTDGTKMYIVGITGDEVQTYNLSTAWDLSTATSAGETFNLNSGIANQTAPSDVNFKSDGTTMWTTCFNTEKLVEWSLSTAWNVSTASYVRDVVMSSSHNLSDLYFSRWNSDGTKFFVGGTTTDGFAEFDASTAYRIDTLTKTETLNFRDSDVVSTVYSYDISDDGSYFFVGGSDSATIAKYKAESMYSITLPSSVQNIPQPLMPDSTVNYEFFTADGGTNVYLINETQTMTK
jgi:hypothetical protein